MNKEQIIQAVTPAVEQRGCFLVEVSVSAENDIEIVIEKEEGVVDWEDCAAIDQVMHAAFSQDDEDYALTVSSAGLDRPFKVFKQFLKAKGTKVDVKFKGGKRLIATLEEATEEKVLALAMKEVGGLLVHISTDYVFGGEPHNTPCREDLPACPTGAYGRTKLHGEEAILRSGVRHLIIRTSWLYSEYGKNFVKTMLRLTSEKPSLKVVFDQVGTPTYAGDLAEALVKMAGLAWDGVIPGPDRVSIYHYSNEGVCSWYDFTKAISEFSGHTDCDIQPCHSNEFPSKVVRPAYSVLDKTKVKQTFGLSVPYWTDSLKKCLKNLSEPLC